MIRSFYAAIGWATCKAMPAGITARAHFAAEAFQTPAASPWRRASGPAGGTSPRPPGPHHHTLNQIGEPPTPGRPAETPEHQRKEQIPMPNPSVSIWLPRGLEVDFTVRESGNYDADDLPITDDTEITVHLGEDTYIRTTIGQWRRLVEAAERGIVAIPADREKRRDQRRQQAEWAAQRAAAKAVSA